MKRQKTDRVFAVQAAAYCDSVCCQVAVRQHDAFASARRARRKNDAGKVVGFDFFVGKLAVAVLDGFSALRGHIHRIGEAEEVLERHAGFGLEAFDFVGALL